MYIPAFLPCFKCFSGPHIRRGEHNQVYAECGCGLMSALVYGNSSDDDKFDDDEIKRIAREWNSRIIFKFYDTIDIV